MHFTGPLGLQFTSTFKGTTVAAAASNLPAGPLAQDPTVDGTSLDAYIAALRDVLLQPNPSDVAADMGNARHRRCPCRD